MAEESAVRLTGGCQCGAVRYVLTERPGYSICHCRMCQKAVGGPFAALASVDAGHLAWTRGRPARFRSSSLAYRGFCAACGTPLTYEGINADKIEVTIGSLDDASVAAPDQAFGREGRLAWIGRLADLPAIDTEEKFAGLVSYQHPDRNDEPAPASGAPP